MVVAVGEGWVEAWKRLSALLKPKKSVTMDGPGVFWGIGHAWLPLGDGG